MRRFPSLASMNTEMSPARLTPSGDWFAWRILVSSQKKIHHLLHCYATWLPLAQGMRQQHFTLMAQGRDDGAAT